MDFKLARRNMLQQQMRTWDVSSLPVLSVCSEVARECFVPKTFRDTAYMDAPIPLAEDRIIWPPKLLARALDALSIRSTESVLQIGCEGGYATACLSMLSDKLSILESDPRLLAQTKANLAQYGLVGIRTIEGSMHTGGLKHGPYDVMIALGSVPMIPPAWHNMLAEHGRLFVIVGVAPAMQALLLSKHSRHQWSALPLFETTVPMLPGCHTQTPFVF